MEQGAYIAIVNKLEEIIDYANKNADADPSPHAADTWRAHARNVRAVQDLIAKQAFN